MRSEALIRTKFVALKGSRHERMARLWAAADVEAIGRSGLAMVSRTIRADLVELQVVIEQLIARIRDGQWRTSSSTPVT